jgi:hypothetical protein
MYITRTSAYGQIQALSQEITSIDTDLQIFLDNNYALRKVNPGGTDSATSVASV